MARQKQTFLRVFGWG